MLISGKSQQSPNKITLQPLSTVGNYPPTIKHVVAHIKLIKYFSSLKEQIDKKPGDWDLFLRSGLRRFIWFVSLLRNKLKTSKRHLDESVQISQFKNSSNAKGIIQNLKTILPPVDILYIWYALIMKTRSFYELGVRFQFLEFSMLSFPLFQVGHSINESTQTYAPHLNYVNNFISITSNQIPYDWKQTLSQKVPVNCPICSQKLGSTYLKDFTRFTSGGSGSVLPSGCKCKFQGVITFQQLIKRQLYSDVMNSERPLPLVLQTKSHFLYETGSDEYVDDLDELDKSLKSILKNDITSLRMANATPESFFQSIDANFDKIYSKFYSQSNLLHLTIPVARPIQVTENFDTIIEATNRFVSKMSKLESWFNAPTSTSTSRLINAISKYESFFMMVAESFRCYSLVPLVEIDLVWQTHKLSPHEYIEFCRSRCQNNVIDSNGDEVQETDEMHTSSFQFTSQFYKTLHHTSYSDCMCLYCFKSCRLVRQSKYSPKIEQYCTSTKPCSKISDNSTTIIHSTPFPSKY
ncbi:hypothetical protein CLIB1423_16S01178 [[Candida] railenensis]|uniref:Uncharacterized protein n=1 Tax=[Candida] railenensis TaxID=45579 RepID=A0A9P0QU65_9ASCO|nr:hypothetical protein CLIB1423_16S01178 [[Candida] railenensis]